MQLSKALFAACLMSAANAAYCTFYSDSECTRQVGGVSYQCENPACFTNDGRYAKCEDLNVDMGNGCNGGTFVTLSGKHCVQVPPGEHKFLRCY